MGTGRKPRRPVFSQRGSFNDEQLGQDVHDLDASRFDVSEHLSCQQTVDDILHIQTFLFPYARAYVQKAGT